MSNKRKAPEEDERSVDKEVSSSDESDGAPQDIVDVDFDFYNPEEIDFHALKRLLSQLFSSDSELINISDIVDILIEENHVGTTVKVDGQESDPYAILSVINLKEQKTKEGIQSLCSYLLAKCPKKNEKLYKAIHDILGLETAAVGWVVSERFINMPVEIMPPMYTMLQQEIAQAEEPYAFDWYMFISKTYKEVASAVDEEDTREEDDNPKQKKSKKNKGKASASSETFYFQAEDEIIAKYATYQFDFKFTNSEKEATADAKRAFSDFGIAPSRKLLLVPQSKFADLVNEIEKTCSSSSILESS
ncbi:Mss4p nuclear export [Apophysomyces ossiformis]|uniref:Protein BCP1 n=1 Tax=Apophysomyces ossiformis TaxID=679940 RepID=A0A8H7C066_9FUNG|nr:Mss4p nuclear export [Apophysomyces ossiformis]